MSKDNLALALEKAAQIMAGTVTYRGWEKDLARALIELWQQGQRTEELQHVAYMNATGGVMNIEEYDRHLNTPAWRWVIEKHWTPVTKLYAAKRAAPQNSPHGEKP